MDKTPYPQHGAQYYSLRRRGVRLFFSIFVLGLLSSCDAGPKVRNKGKEPATQQLTKLDNYKDADRPGKLTSTNRLPDTLPLGNYQEAMPPFKIRLVDGNGYTFKDLTKGKPTILIYFQPDCPECQKFTAALIKRLPQLVDQQFVMISYEDIKQVRAFDDHFHLSSHPNVKIGSEGYTFVVQKYYQIVHFPFVCCYDGTGRLLRILNPGLDPSLIATLL